MMDKEMVRGASILVANCVKVGELGQLRGSKALGLWPVVQYTVSRVLLHQCTQFVYNWKIINCSITGRTGYILALSLSFLNNSLNGEHSNWRSSLLEDVFGSFLAKLQRIWTLVFSFPAAMLDGSNWDIDGDYREMNGFSGELSGPVLFEVNRRWMDSMNLSNNHS